MNTPSCIQAIPDLARLVDDANRLHVKSVECPKTLREFLAAILSYMPGWMRMLYRVRWVFVRLLGTRQEGVPQRLAIAPEELSFTPGKTAAFFTVASAEEGRYWAGVATDRMISGYLAVVAEPQENGANRFHILTLVKYRHWTGPIYFTVIAPFHHLVVFCMARAGVRAEA